jgi:hypothetical protein
LGWNDFGGGGHSLRHAKENEWWPDLILIDVMRSRLA